MTLTEQVTSKGMELSGEQQNLGVTDHGSHLYSICVSLSYFRRSANYAPSQKNPERWP